MRRLSPSGVQCAALFTVRSVVVVAVLLGAGCAGIGESVAGTCLSLGLRVGAQICVDTICDDDDNNNNNDDDDDDDDEALAEIEPPPRDEEALALEAMSDTVACRLRDNGRGAWRLGCIDGTAALAIRPVERGLYGDPPPPSGLGDAEVFPIREDRTYVGDVVIASAGDAASLSGIFAIEGSLLVESPDLLRLTVPTLRSVTGDVVVQNNRHLVRVDFSRLVSVGGVVVVRHNTALSADPMPRLRRATTVMVVDNDALPNVVVDRLQAVLP